MKIIKQVFAILFILIVVGISFRGWFYRHLITYKSIGMRTNYSVKDDKLANYIDINVNKQIKTDIEEVTKLALAVTSKKLNFTANKNNVDPNELINSKSAHCVGYASFFATTCNYLLAKYKLADKWTAKPQVGQLYFLGTNIHAYSESSFFKDHDFVTVENKITGESFAVDPTVNDYLYIDLVTYAKR
jgi:hypothetical protein